MTFPLDRLLAILGILLEEYDYDSRPQEPEYLSGVPGEETELELGRVHVYGAVRFFSAYRQFPLSDSLCVPPSRWSSCLQPGSCIEPPSQTNWTVPQRSNVVFLTMLPWLLRKISQCHCLT